MRATPRPKKPNMKMGTSFDCCLYSGGTGGVYRAEGFSVTLPELLELVFLTRLRRFRSSATPMRIGRDGDA